MIGGFVVGAAVLALAAVALFGGGQLFSEKASFVSFFPGSLSGLNIGAPVTFRGVRIGAVTNIVVRYDSKDQSVRIPVYFEIDTDRVDLVRDRRREPYENFNVLIEQGLRAQLVMQSFVTGQIAVQIDFAPNEPAEYIGADPTHFEFPTISSTVEKMGKALEDFDFDGLLKNIDGTIKGVNELANSPKLRDAIASLDETIDDFGKLARDVSARVEPIARTIDEVGTSARRALDQVTESVASVQRNLDPAIVDARQLIQNLDGRVDPAVTSFLQTAESAQAALEQAKNALAAARSILVEDSEFYQGALRTMDELSAAARSVRMLADLLEQHPEALLQGKNMDGVK